MATIPDMLDVETEVEGVFKTFLGTIVTAATIYKSDTNEENDTPNIGVVATLIEQGRHQITVPTGTYAGRPIYDQFRIRVDLSIRYDPSYSQGQASLRSRLRLGLTDYTALNTQFGQNAYLILAPDTLRQIDGSRDIDDEAKEETIGTVVEGMFFLNPVTLQSVS
jgi:hypothetical protein